MNPKRLKIISPSEVSELYDRPHFTESAQQTYFALNKAEYKVMAARGSLASKVHFILQLGYFKATSQFFNCSFNEVQADVTFILQEYFDNARLKTDTLSKRTRRSNQALIGTLERYNVDKAMIKTKFATFLATKTQLCNNPVYLFHEVLCYANQHKLMLLGYSSLQDLIGYAIINQACRNAPQKIYQHPCC